MNQLSFSKQALHLFIFSTMAVSAPLLDVLSHNIQFFVVRDSEAIDLPLMLTVLCLVIPAFFVFVEWVVLRVFGRKIQTAVHAMLALFFFFLFFLVFFSRGWTNPGVLLIALAAIFSFSALVFYQLKHVQIWITLMAPSLFVVPAVFLSFYPSARDPQRETIPVSSDTPVVIFILDELPISTLLQTPQEVDAAAFPNFAFLVQHATWYRQATSNSDGTEYALPAILSGTYPDVLKLFRLASYPRNLFTMLEGSYDFNVIELITRLCPREPSIQKPGSLRATARSLFMDLSVIYANILLPPGLRGSVPSVEGDWGNFWKPKPGAPGEQDRLQGFHDFLPGIQAVPPGARPPLHFLHFGLPHNPFEYLASGIKYDASNDLLPMDQVNKDETACALQYERHRMQTIFADKLLGELIGRLRDTGLYDRSLIIVTSDHGVSFVSGERRRMATARTAFELMHVPLIIKYPGQGTGVVTDRDAQTIDILPTVVDVLRVKLPWNLEGRSLLGDEIKIKRTKKYLNDTKRRYQIYPAQEDHMGEVIQFLNGLLEKRSAAAKEYPQWIGRRLDGVQVKQETEYAIRLTNAGAFGKVDPQSGFLPAFVTGVLEGRPPAAAGLPVLISINHVIRAVTTTALVPRKPEPVQGVQAFVPESSFHAGNNTVGFFTFADPAGKTLLAIPVIL